MQQMSGKFPPVGTLPEVELLLCCARTCINPQSTDRLKTLLQGRIDWTYVIWAALSHQMMPLVFWGLSTTYPETVPKLIFNQLRDHFNAIVRRNLFLTGELLKILDLFNAHGISAIPLKGPVLAASVYGNVALRQFGDLDILVHEQDVLRAQDLLICNGYHADPPMSDAQVKEHLRSAYYDLVFIRDNAKVKIELHWRLTSKSLTFRLDHDHVWERVESVSLAGRKVPSLSPDDLLLYLSAHGSKHFWEKLFWICDIAKLIHAHSGINWGCLMRSAQTYGNERMLFLGLILARDLFEVALPEEVLKKMKADNILKPLSGYVYKNIFSEAYGGNERRYPFYLFVTERWRDRFVLLRLAVIPNERDRALLPLPKFLYFFYYLLRPVRLIAEYGRKPSKHLHQFLKVLLRF